MIAKSLYNAEVERIEEEYEGAAKGVVERLLEGVEERRKRLMEEKEGEGVSLGKPFLLMYLCISLEADLSSFFRYILRSSS